MGIQCDFSLRDLHIKWATLIIKHALRVPAFEASLDRLTGFEANQKLQIVNYQLTEFSN